MKLTIYEVAQVVGAKNDISIFEDAQLENAEFDSRLIATGDLFVPSKMLISFLAPTTWATSWIVNFISTPLKRVEAREL